MKTPRKVLSAELKSAVWEKSQGRCWYCGVQCNPFTNLHIDHIRARVKGGDDSIDNLVVSCVSCNQAKRDLFVFEFRRKQFGSAIPRWFWHETDAGQDFLMRQGAATLTIMGEVLA